MSKSVPKGIRQIVIEHSPDPSGWRAWCYRMDGSKRILSAWGGSPKRAVKSLMSLADLMGVEVAGGQK